MNLYQRANQFLARKNLRKPITSGGNDDFIRSYRKGDINETNLFRVTCEETYYCPKGVKEENLTLLGIDGSGYSRGDISFFSKTLFIPTPIFFRQISKDEDIMYFHPSRMKWEKVGNISPEERYGRLKELSESLNN